MKGKNELRICEAQMMQVVQEHLDRRFVLNADKVTSVKWSPDRTHFIIALEEKDEPADAIVITGNKIQAAKK